MLIAFFLLAACASPPKGRVVILGMDGLELSMLDRLIAGGELPNFHRVMDEGVRAKMAITTPIMSPILWTTIASGYPAEVHGVGGWTNGRGHSFSGADVRVERIWDVVSADQRPSVVAGWLMTWPASPIEGAMLSERFVWSFPMNKDPGEKSVAAAPDRDATTFPDALADRATALRPDDAWLMKSPLAYQVKEYGAPFHPLLRDETHVRVFESLWPESHAALGAIYVNGADQVSHLYWPFSDPDVYERIRRNPDERTAIARAESKPGRRPLPYADGIDEEKLALAARYVPDYYRYLDTVLGRVMTLIEPDTTLIVCSDHGFRVSSANPLINGSHNDSATFLAWGAHVRKGVKDPAVHVFDVAPTVYALLGEPAAKDMPGHVLTDVFDVTPVAPVDSYQLPRVAIDVGSADGGTADQQLRDQLEALGYIDEQGLPNTAIGASRKADKLPAKDPQ